MSDKRKETERPDKAFSPNVEPIEIPLLVVGEDGLLIDPKTGKKYRYVPEWSPK